MHEPTALDFANNSFVRNEAMGTLGDSGGGAIYVREPGAGTIVDSHFCDNTAHNGGAVFFHKGDVSLSRADFVLNHASQLGGAIAAGETGAAVQLDHLTLVLNDALNGDGQAIHSPRVGFAVDRSLVLNHGDVALHASVTDALTADRNTYQGNTGDTVGRQRWELRRSIRTRAPGTRYQHRLGYRHRH